jgi:HSP20 family protein
MLMNPFTLASPVGPFSAWLRHAWEPELRSGAGLLARSSHGPAINVLGSPDGILVRAALSGVDPDALELSLEDDKLILSGEIQSPPEDERKSVQRERPSGRFRRTVRLPFQVEPDEIEASFENGWLEVRLPRAKKERPLHIRIDRQGSPKGESND